MRKRSDIRDLLNDDTSGVDGSDSRFTTLSRTFNINLYFTKTEVISDLCTVLSHHLSGVRSILFRTSVTHFTCGRPGDYLTVVVGKGNNDIIKRSINERFT